ncbi:MAG: molybdenum cofactor guanylyltransferase [Thermodesulfobacteriota bacterium]
MKSPCSGVILAGGLSTRFSGQDKALISVGQRRILDRIYDVFIELFDEIFLVTNNPVRYLQWDLNIVSDIYPIRSSLTGIHAGLFYASNPYVFFAACDTPFVKKDLIEAIIDRIDPGFDAVIPETSAGLEPLCAVYAKRCLNRIEAHLLQGKLKIQLVFKENRIKKLPERILRQIDPELQSFFNINTPDDLAAAEKLMGRADQ